MKDCGVLYFLIAEKEKYKGKVINVHADLLIRSLKSLKRHMSDIPAILFTNIDDIDWKDHGFDEVVYRDGSSDIWIYKYECLLETPFYKTIHMDCDTYVCAPFYDVFTMLDNVNFAVPFSPWYTRRMPHSVPTSFPEPAGGFMAYKFNDEGRKLIEYIKELVVDRSWGCDEPWIRKALYFMDVKFSILPWEYNCVFLLPGFVLNNVRVLHGKGADEVVEFLEKNMGEFGPKLYTGERVLHLDSVRKRGYKIGDVDKYGRDKM